MFFREIVEGLRVYPVGWEEEMEVDPFQQEKGRGPWGTEPVRRVHHAQS